MDCKYSDNILYIIASLRSVSWGWVNVGFSGGVLAVCFWVIRCSDALLECPSREALRARFAFPFPVA